MDKANMSESTRICFSDSIGSYGRSAPRKEASADWLVQNPNQDPGSDYGKQKREIRGLLKKSKYDTRWAIIPGVLNSDEKWGAGTTEYALDMILHAVQKKKYVCPIDPEQYLPMIY
jgi:threonine 3-dehydrogenase